jgi:uncharacterized protein (DUF849 family)
VEIQACINGSRVRDAHVRLPRSAAELGWDARDCAEAGATSVHVHPREPRRESMTASAVARAVNAIRAAAPGLPVGVTTGAWLVENPRDRVRLIEEWDVLPDFASVNWHEDGAAEVAAALLDRGIGLEVGLWTLSAARTWVSSHIESECLRVLVELPSRATVDLADEILDIVGDEYPLLVHGEEESCWPALQYSLARGHGIRIGLEDTLELPDGSSAGSNADLVRAALQLS